MPDYARSDVKERAREHWRGACNVTLPSYTKDFTNFNEAGIRHDVQRAAQFGFWGTLAVGEYCTTEAEYLRFLEIVLEEAPAGFKVVSHLSFESIEEMAHVACMSYQMGAEAGIFAYPKSLVPSSAQQIVDWTTEVARASDLALIIQAAPTWGFKRLDSSGFPKVALEKIADIDTVAALQFEVGGPATMSSFSDAIHSYGDRVLIEIPMEHFLPVQFRDYGVRWIGASSYESFGGRIPEVLRSLDIGDYNKAMEVFWSFQAGREAKETFHARLAGAELVFPIGWKYLGWLNGFNGGLLRMPHMRLNPGQMEILRAGLSGSGFELPAEDSGFHAGRVS